MMCANCGKAIVQVTDADWDWVHQNPVSQDQPEYCFAEPRPPYVAEPDE